MGQSIESKIIELMAVDDHDGVREILSSPGTFLDGELRELYGSAARLVDLITEEIRRRGGRT